jgi:hypothetical protein
MTINGSQTTFNGFVFKGIDRTFLTLFNSGNATLNGRLTLSGTNDAQPNTAVKNSDLSAYQTVANLSTNLAASSIRYPNNDAVNTGLALKANLTGGNTFTGINNFPTAAAGSNTNEAATMEALQTANSNNVLLTGNQTKTGRLSFTNSTIDSGISASMTSSAVNPSYGGTNSSPSLPMYATSITSSGAGFSSAIGGIGAVGFDAAGASNGTGFRSALTTLGVNFTATIGNSTNGYVSNALSSSTGYQFLGQNQGSMTYNVDKFGTVFGEKYTLRVGSNASAGNATLVAGTVTVTTTAATSSSLILLTHKTSGGTLGITDYITTNGSFTITSNNVLDTSTYTYLIIN